MISSCYDSNDKVSECFDMGDNVNNDGDIKVYEMRMKMIELYKI